MTEQTKAQRLADFLKGVTFLSDLQSGLSPITGDAIAAELRRLDANEEALLEALYALADLYDTDEGCKSLPQYQQARALITRIEAEMTDHITLPRSVVEQAKMALEFFDDYVQPLTDKFGGPKVPEPASTAWHVHAAIAALRAALAAQQAEPVQHWSDCAVNNGPALPVAPCDCGGYTAPHPAQPVIQAQFECDDGELIGTTSAPVKRVEAQDDGSYTVVIDHWPRPPADHFPDAGKMVLEPLILDEKQMLSACLSYRHDFGLLEKDEQSRVLFAANEWLRAFNKEAAHNAKLAKRGGV